MVTTKPTESPQGASDESVPITPEIRRRVLRDEYARRLAAQRVVAEFERRDRKAQGFPGDPLYTVADLRVSNAVAVLQDIAASLSALGENRDF
jgi:hypothetical protein